MSSPTERSESKKPSLNDLKPEELRRAYLGSSAAESTKILALHDPQSLPITTVRVISDLVKLRQQQKDALSPISDRTEYQRIESELRELDRLTKHDSRHPYLERWGDWGTRVELYWEVTVFINMRPVILNQVQCRMLQAIVQKEGKPVWREDLSREIWGDARRADTDVAHQMAKVIAEIQTVLDQDLLLTLSTTDKKPKRGYLFKKLAAENAPTFVWPELKSQKHDTEDESLNYLSDIDFEDFMDKLWMAQRQERRRVRKKGVKDLIIDELLTILESDVEEVLADRSTRAIIGEAVFNKALAVTLAGDEVPVQLEYMTQKKILEALQTHSEGLTVDEILKLAQLRIKGNSLKMELTNVRKAMQNSVWMIAGVGRGGKDFKYVLRLKVAEKTTPPPENPAYGSLDFNNQPNQKSSPEAKTKRPFDLQSPPPVSPPPAPKSESGGFASFFDQYKFDDDEDET